MKNREVKIMIKGTQHDFSDESIENTYVGHYAVISGSHMIKYDEYLEDMNISQSTNENLVKISNNTIHIKKRGAVNTQMYFEQGRKYHGVYQTPFGDFDMIIETENVTIQETEDTLDILILYDLSLNHCPMSKCTIQMQISGLQEA